MHARRERLQTTDHTRVEVEVPFLVSVCRHEMASLTVNWLCSKYMFIAGVPDTEILRRARCIAKIWSVL